MRHGAEQLCRLLALFLLLAGVSQAQAAGLLVIASSDAELYSRFIEHFTASLSGTLQESGAVAISVVYLDKDSITDDRLAAADSIVTIGARAARDIATQVHDKPVLHTIIPESIYRSVAPSPGACTMRSAIFIDQPLARQAALAQLMFPAAESYGILLGPTSGQRLSEIETLRKHSDRKLVIRSTGHEPKISVAANGLLHEVDLLLAVNDPLVLNRENAKWLLYSAYQSRLPVIGFSQAYVKAGAAGAVYSEPEQMAQQAAEIIAHLNTVPHDCLPEASFPRYFGVAVNQSVCSSLGGADCDEHELGARLTAEETRP